MVLWLFQTTLSLAVMAGVGSLESNLVPWQRISFPLGAREAGEVNRGELQEGSFWEHISHLKTNNIVYIQGIPSSIW